MKIRKVSLKNRSVHRADVYKTKCFETEQEARAWGEYVEKLLTAAAAAKRLGLSPQQAILTFCGSAAPVDGAKRGT